MGERKVRMWAVWIDGLSAPSYVDWHRQSAQSYAIVCKGRVVRVEVREVKPRNGRKVRRRG